MDNLPTSVYKILYEDEMKKINVAYMLKVGYFWEIVWDANLAGWSYEFVCE